MITRTKLIDATNSDWGVLDTGEFWWREGDYDLEVRVYNQKGTGKTNSVMVKHRDADWAINLGNDWQPWIEIAIAYAQHGDTEGWAGGSEEHFWHMAKAIKKFGTEPMFGSTPEGIYAHVGPDLVFMEYTDGRYDLFDEGCHAFAGTPEGVLDAYNKLQEEIKMFSRIEG